MSAPDPSWFNCLTPFAPAVTGPSSGGYGVTLWSLALGSGGRTWLSGTIRFAGTMSWGTDSDARVSVRGGPSIGTILQGVGGTFDVTFTLSSDVLAALTADGASATIEIDQDDPTDWTGVACIVNLVYCKCDWDLDPTGAHYGKLGGSGSFTVYANDGSCAWSAYSEEPWIHLTGEVDGGETGSVSYSVDPQTPGSWARTGAIEVRPYLFTITQDGWPIAEVRSLDQRPEPDCMGHSQFSTITWPFGYCPADLNALLGDFDASFNVARAYGSELAAIDDSNVLRLTDRAGAEPALSTVVPDVRIWRYRYGSG